VGCASASADFEWYHENDKADSTDDYGHDRQQMADNNGKQRRQKGGKAMLRVRCGH
jgi:hypothetical protein